MVENDQENDEYRFVELDNPSDEPMSEEPEPQDSSSFSGGFKSQKDIKRNASIVIAISVLVMFLYKVAGYVHSEKKEPVTAQKNVQKPINPVAVSTEMPIQPEVVSAPVVAVSTQPVTVSDNPVLIKKVDELESREQGIQTELGSVNQQINTFNNNLNHVTNQLNNLQQVINNLSAQLEKQSLEMATLTKKATPKKNQQHIMRLAIPTMTYSIQAIIPGRAWLIAGNGSTITVREGTKINGYGTVNLIDPLEGRVVTSSGKVIRFSQEDS